MPATDETTTRPDNTTTKAALFFITAGLLLLSYGLYAYTRPLPPPNQPFKSATTSKPAEVYNISYTIEVSTTLKGFYVVDTIPLVFPTTTIIQTADTKTIPESCTNGQLDPDEEYEDCGIQCGGCVLINLTDQWKRYLNENLWLRYDGYSISQIAGGPCRDANWTDLRDRPVEYDFHYCMDKVFNISVLSAEETPDHREMRLDDVDYIDGFEVKLTSDFNETVGVYAKRDLNALQLIPEYAVLTVGGRNCVSNNTGFCRRHWNGYEFSLRMRETDTVRMDLTTPSGKKLDNVQLNKSQPITLEGVKISLLYPYQKGGYCTVYVKKSIT